MNKKQILDVVKNYECLLELIRDMTCNIWELRYPGYNETEKPYPKNNYLDIDINSNEVEVTWEWWHRTDWHEAISFPLDYLWDDNWKKREYIKIEKEKEKKAKEKREKEEQKTKQEYTHYLELKGKFERIEIDKEKNNEI